MLNLVVPGMVVDLFEGGLRVVDPVKGAKEGRAAMARVEIRVKRCTMVNPLLLLETPKIQVMAQNGVRQKAKNLFIRVLGSLEILAKASDF